MTPIVCDSGDSGAVFSADMRHRYQLYRRLRDSREMQQTTDPPGSTPPAPEPGGAGGQDGGDAST